MAAAQERSDPVDRTRPGARHRRRLHARCRRARRAPGGERAPGPHGPDPGGARRRLRDPVRHRRAAGRAPRRADRPAAARAPARPQHRLRGAELGGRCAPGTAAPAGSISACSSCTSTSSSGCPTCTTSSRRTCSSPACCWCASPTRSASASAGRSTSTTSCVAAYLAYSCWVWRVPAGRGALDRPADDRRDDVPARHLPRVHRPRSPSGCAAACARRCTRRASWSTASSRRQRALETQARDLEEARRRAEQANVAKAQFLATISHEIRTPMNGVLGTTELLLDTPLDAEPAPSRRDRAPVGDGAARPDRRRARPVAHRGEQAHPPRDDLRPARARPRGGRPDGDDGARQAGHPELHDLAAPARARRGRSDAPAPGARQPAPQRGQVHRARPRRPRGARRSSATDDAVRLRFEVRDTGIGIAEDQFDSVFDAFTQVDASSTRRHGGSGLGLAIVKELAELMGGRVGVDSQLDQGSTFWFELSLKRGADAGAGAGAARRRGRRRRAAGAHPARRGRRRQPDGRRPRCSRSSAAASTSSTTARPPASAAAQHALRPRLHGLPHAGDGRLRGDAPHPRARRAAAARARRSSR